MARNDVYVVFEGVDQIWAAIERVAESSRTGDTCQLSKEACRLLLADKKWTSPVQAAGG